MVISSYIRILALDISYRDTGVCMITKEDGCTSIDFVKSLTCPPLGGMGFKSLEDSSTYISKSANKINNIICSNYPDIIVAEMPAFTQSAESALAIGMCWGMIRSIPHDIFIIEPSFLKRWSESKAGDKKIKVKEKVLQRIFLNTNNDNIIDAAGIALAINDLITYEIIQTKKQDTDSRAFNLQS